MSIDLDYNEIKEKTKKFTPKNDRLSAIIQLGICLLGVCFVFLHELNSSKKKNKS